MITISIRRLAAFVVVMLVGSAFVFEQYFFPQAKTRYDQLVAVSDATIDEQALLKTILTSVAHVVGEDRTFNVNGNYEHTKINVALVDFDAIAQNQADVPQEGMFALPPNVLAIDTKMFRSIMLQAIIDLRYASRMYIEAAGMDSPAELLSVSTKYGALGLRMRLKSLTEQKDDVTSRVALSMLQQLNYQGYLVLPYVFPIAHELYHLRSSARFGLDVAIEETQADQFALKVAAKYLSDQNALTGQDFLRKQMLFAGLRYFQDRVVERAFAGFRGLNADSLFPVLIHAQCNSRIKTIPWPERFAHPESVIEGDKRGLPILTDEEVTELRMRLGTFSRRDHEHILRRIVRFMDIVAKDDVFRLAAPAFELSRDLLRIYEDGQANENMFHQGDLPEPGHIQISDLVSQIQAKPRPVSAVGCEGGRCLYGSVGDGYVEIFGEHNHVRQLVLAQPLDPVAAEYILSALAKFIGHERALMEFARFFSRIDSCLIASAVISDPSYLIVVRLMNADGWIEMQAIARGTKHDG